MRRPDAAARTLAQPVLRDSGPQNGYRDRPLICQISPGARSAGRRSSPPPSLSDRKWSAYALRAAPGRRGWNIADQTANLIDSSRKADTGQVAGKSEDVALGIREWIEPAPAAMDDDDDLAFPAPVLHGARRALLEVHHPAFALEHGGAGHLVSQCLDFMPFHRSIPPAPRGGRSFPCPDLISLPSDRPRGRPRSRNLAKGAPACRGGAASLAGFPAQAAKPRPDQAPWASAHGQERTVRRATRP